MSLTSYNCRFLQCLPYWNLYKDIENKISTGFDLLQKEKYLEKLCAPKVAINVIQMFFWNASTIEKVSRYKTDLYQFGNN